MSRALHRTVCLVLLAMGLGACGHDATLTSSGGGLVAVLPAERAYIAGIVVSRDARFAGSSSVLVAVNPRDVYGSPSADVMLTGDYRILWRSGARATAADLQVGREVTVWAGPVELRSLPPVVTARVIVIER